MQLPQHGVQIQRGDGGVRHHKHAPLVGGHVLQNATTNMNAVAALAQIDRHGDFAHGVELSSK